MRVILFLNWRQWSIGFLTYANGDWDVFLLPLTIRFWRQTDIPF